jgi:hypothetical protein
MSAEAAWHADPYGRFEKRYWNGSEWTEHVFSAGIQSSDPISAPGAAPRAAAGAGVNTAPASVAGAGQTVPTGTRPSSPPLATPATAPSAAGTTQSVATQVTAFLDRLGPLARERGQVSLRDALSGAAGALWAFGIIVLVANDSDDTGPMTVAAALLIAAAVAGSIKGSQIAGSIPALTGVAAVAVPAFVFTLMDDAINESRYAVPSLLVAALFLGLWLAPGLRGRPILFGAGVYALVTFIATLGSDQTYCGPYDDDCLSFDYLQSALRDQGWLFVLVGAGLLAAVYWADRRGYHGIGTGLVVTALISITSGTVLIAIAADNGSDTSGPLVLVAIAGVAMAWVGTVGGRRATTWWGVTVCAIGLPAAILVAADPEDEATAGILLILAGLVLFGIPVLLNKITAANSAGGASSTGQP